VRLDSFVVRTEIIPAPFPLIGPRCDQATVPTMQAREVDTALGRVHVRISGAGEAMMFWPSLLMIEEFVFRG
jgi:hypothetical protein